jgi:cytochrome P450 family 142 subfamily A polypeptide 1
MTTIDAAAPRPAVDLVDPEFYRSDPHEAFAWMRAHEPVFRDRARGLWGITRHADVLDVERRSDVFVSGRGYRRVFEPMENNMIAQDDPVHQAQRRLISGRFTPRSVREHEAPMRALIDELLDPVADRGSMEVIDDLAAQLPARLTARLLGFPEDDWRRVKSWSERLMRTDSRPEDAGAAAGFYSACQEFYEVLVDVAEERSACPADDLVSTWVRAELDGEPWAMDRIFNETGLMISGGSETSRTVIAHGLRAFCDHPDQWELLAERPELVPTAVEELIRWVTPLNNFFRTAVRDTVVGGQAIAEGDRVILLYPSANRDQAVFPEPDRFDVTRDPNPHVAFGYGTHFCLGANFARLELRLLFAELTRRFTEPRVITEPDVEPNMFTRAVRAFDLALTPR